MVRLGRPKKTCHYALEYHLRWQLWRAMNWKFWMKYNIQIQWIHWKYALSIKKRTYFNPLEEPRKNAINKKIIVLHYFDWSTVTINPSGDIKYWTQFFWFMGGEGQDILFIFWMWQILMHVVGGGALRGLKRARKGHMKTITSTFRVLRQYYYASFEASLNCTIIMQRSSFISCLCLMFHNLT